MPFFLLPLHPRPLSCRDHKLPSVSICDRKFLLCKNVAIAWNRGHPRPKLNILVQFWATSLLSQTCFCLKRLPSVAVLLRWDFQQRHGCRPSSSSAFENSLLNSVLPCTLFNGEFAEQTRYCVEPRTSVSVSKMLGARQKSTAGTVKMYILAHFDL